MGIPKSVPCTLVEDLRPIALVVSWQKLKNLSPRSHFTQFGKEASDFVNVTAGVLQGSKLGPIAFVIKINMLPSVIEQVARGVNDDVVDEDTILFMHDTTSWEVLDVHNHGNISKKIDLVKTLPKVRKWS